MLIKHRDGAILCRCPPVNDNCMDSSEYSVGVGITIISLEKQQIATLTNFEPGTKISMM